MGTTSIRRCQPSLRNHPCRLKASFTSRLGTLSILQARLMHWSSTSALQAYQASHLMSLPCASIDGTPTPIGPSLSPVLTCSRCMTSVESLKLRCRRWVLTIPDCQWHVTQASRYRHTMPTDEAAAAKAHSDRMRALMAGEAPPRFTSTQLQSNRNSHPSLQVCHPSNQMQVGPPERQLQRGTSKCRLKQEQSIGHLQPNSVRVQACYPSQSTGSQYMAMEHNANGFSMGEWYVGSLSLEVGESLFSQKVSWVQPHLAMVF